MWMQCNLVADPVPGATASCLKGAKFRMAASGRRFDKASEGWVDTDTVYMSVNCWKQRGLNVLRTLPKGDTGIVVGRLRFRECDAPDGGGRRQVYEIEASSFGPDLARYVAELGRPLREVADADAATVPAQQAQQVDDPWGAPVPAAGAEETAA